MNARTIPDRYPVKNIQDCSHRIHGSHVFSVVDLVKAYTQIPVNPADVPRTAIITPFGLFEFPFMSFGLRNAGQTFQRFIDEVVSDLEFASRTSTTSSCSLGTPPSTALTCASYFSASSTTDSW